MDSFIKIVEQKNKIDEPTIHTERIDLIRRYMKEGKNIFICGALGVGKTFILNKVLEGTNHVELLPEHMKSKSNFLSLVESTSKHVFIDGYDPVFKPVIDKVSDGGKISRGSLLITTTTMCMYPNFETVLIPKHTPGVLMTLTDRVGPVAYAAAERANGNIRNFFTYLEGYDDMDVFKTPKEFIADILTDPTPIKILDSISEHGHIWDIFQENYLDSKGVDVVRAAESFSEADAYDVCMYSHGEWNLMPYLVLHALTIPKTTLGEPLVKEKIRPGSCWTKYGNYKMRKQKFKEIQNKSRMGLGVEELCLLKKYAEKGDLEPLMEYDITPQDFDVINHLAVGSSLKSRDVTRIKKALNNAHRR